MWRSIHYTNCCRNCALKDRGIKQTKHGESGNTKSKLYNVWLGMRNRCNNANNKRYEHYGGRDISVCEDWNDYNNFKLWAINNGYQNDLTIERKDVNGNYEPSNCSWVTMKEQSNNKRNNHKIIIENREKTVVEWCEYLNLYKSNVYIKAKKIGVLPDEYIKFKYYHRDKVATKKNILDFLNKLQEEKQ